MRATFARFAGQPPYSSGRRFPPKAALLSIILTAAAVSGCEYTYNDGRSELPASPLITESVKNDPLHKVVPVSGAALIAWAKEALSNADGQVVQTNFGRVEGGGTETQSTGPLPAGTYSVTVACRSKRKVLFRVSDAHSEPLRIKLRCGMSQAKVMYLLESSVLKVTVEARRDANFAYSISRI